MNSAESRSRRAQRLMQEAAESLRQGHSRQAVRQARKAAQRIGNPFLRAFNLAAVLIDAGAELKSSKLVREGIQRLKSVEGQVPPGLLAAFHYNFGNAYAVLGQRERGLGVGTRPSLSSAVSHLDEALSLNTTPDARANLAGVLMAQGRWVEALDEFEAVLTESPEHHSALARRGSALIGIHNWTPDHKGLLAAALADHERALELAKDEPVFACGYRAVVANLRRHVKLHSAAVRPPTSDQKWIWENRLALNPCPICRVESPDAFDIYPLAARLIGGNRRPRTDETIDLVNSICRSFATARWILYKAMGDDPPRETRHVVTLGGTVEARHDLRIGLVMTAASGFHSVLSQIAFALNSYFHLGHCVRAVTLDTVWSVPGKKSRSVPTDRTSIHPKLTRMATPALSALHRLALSFEHGLGRYSDLRDLRNHLEHHVVVPVLKFNETRAYVALDPKRLEVQALKMGQIAKAAVWYFGAAVLRGEQERLKRALRRGHPVARAERDYVDRR